MSPSLVVKPDDGLTSDPEKTFIADCRLCAKKSSNFIDIFSEAGIDKDLPFAIKFCAPVLVIKV